MSIVYNAAAVYVFGHGSWYLLIRKYPLNTVVPFLLLIPVIGVGSSVALLGERLTSSMLLGGIIALTGVAIIVSRRPSVASGTTEKS